MVVIQVGPVVGEHHEMRYTKDGCPVLLHRPHRSITAPMVNQFHAPTGTTHVMRHYVEEYVEDDDWCRFLWKSYCAQYRLSVAADGRCSQKADAGMNASPWCHHCQTCQRLWRRFVSHNKESNFAPQ